MRILTALGAALLGMGIVSSASAADLPRREAMPTKAVPYVSMYNWTGFYAGVNAGYGWTDGFGDADGFVGGGQIGYNWQAAGSPFVFGIEADFQGADLSSSVTGAGFTATARSNAFGTVRGRIGYAWDRAMIYATGGWAYTRTELSITAPGFAASNNEWSSGYALGGGIEWAAWDRWTVKAEYLYIHSGDVSVTAGPFTASGDYSTNLVRAGLNYRF
ncbi:MAG: porin family protein [Pseudolabrys sp.]|nr:porin family protein [Pseudolabrys sp.]